MAGFLNLRDGDGFVFILRQRSSRGQTIPSTAMSGRATVRAELLRALRGATVARFLIATDQILEIELSHSQQRRKYFLIATNSRCLQRSAVLASTAKLAMAGFANSKAKSRRDAGATKVKGARLKAAATLRSRTAGSQDESRCSAIHKFNSEVNFARLPFGQTGGRYRVKRKRAGRSVYATPAFPCGGRWTRAIVLVSPPVRLSQGFWLCSRGFFEIRNRRGTSGRRIPVARMAAWCVEGFD